MDSDLGQSYLLQGNSGSWEIKVYDTNGNLYHDRSYAFGFPGSCPGMRCGGDPAYEVAYQNGVSNGSSEVEETSSYQKPMKNLDYSDN